MYQIKDLSKETISKWNTTELVEKFKDTRRKHNSMNDYLSSDQVRYCDAFNTLLEIRKIEEKHKLNKYNLEDIHEEIIFRINSTGQRVYLFKDNEAFLTYVLPKCNNDDSIAFVICKNNNFYSLHKKDYNIYLQKDVLKLNYKIDRDENNDIKWHSSFSKYNNLTEHFNKDFEKYYISKYNNKYGVVDENGNDIVPPIYDYINEFYFNLAKVELCDRKGVINYNGDEVVKCEYDDVIIPEYFISSKNRPIIVRNNRKFGVICENGELLLPIKYSCIDFLGENMLLVSDNDNDIVFDFEGNPITKTYRRITYFSENLIQVLSTNGSGLINNLGEEVAPPIYYWIDSIKHGLAMVHSNDGNYGFLDETGNIVVPAIYSQVRVFDKDLILVSLNRKYGLLDRNGNKVTDIIYDRISYFNSEVIKVEIDREEYFINKQGETVIESKDNPFQRDRLGDKFENWKYTGR